VFINNMKRIVFDNNCKKVKLKASDVFEKDETLFRLDEIIDEKTAKGVFINRK